MVKNEEKDKMDSKEMTHLKPIFEKEFWEIGKGCGIKYQNKIPSRELMLGYRPLNNRMVEIRDEELQLQDFWQHAKGGDLKKHHD